MNNLTEKMQERLDKWRNKTLPVPSTKNIRNQNVRPSSNSRGDFGDVMSQEEWDEEIRKSQTRR